MANYTHEELVGMMKQQHSYASAIAHINTLVPRRIQWEGITLHHSPELYCRFPQFNDRPFAYHRGGEVRYFTSEEAFQMEDKSNEH